MKIKELKEKIKSLINEEPEIIFITKTGGHLFCDNCKDIDYRVVIKNELDKVVKFYNSETNEDYFIHSLDIYNSHLNFENSDYYNLFILDDLFKKDYCDFGDKTTNLKLLENADKYKEMLKRVLPKSHLNPRIRWGGSDKYCNKRLWWTIMGLKFIDNNSYEITDEIKDIIQRCHDGVLEKSWEDWVKQKIGL